MLHLQQLLPANGALVCQRFSSSARYSAIGGGAKRGQIDPVFGLPQVAPAAARLHSPPTMAKNFRHGRLGASGDTGATDSTVISESPLRRAFGEFSELSVPSVASVSCVRRAEKPPTSTHSRGGVWSAVRRGLTQTGLPVQRACAGVSRASSARSYSAAACVCGDSPSRPSVARKWLR
jgi:hypothetical protein